MSSGQGCRSEIPVHPPQSLDLLGPHGAGVFPRCLAALAVELRFERKLLAFVERAHAGALDGADMHEHVVAAVVRLNEAEALCRVEPLNCSGSHLTSPRCAQARCTRTTFARA